MKNNIEALTSYMAICSLHVARLKMVLDKTADLFPIMPDRMEALSLEELGCLEILTSRFSRLQDTLGAKVFPRLADLLTNDPTPRVFIDTLHLLEKYNLLPSRLFWEEMREVRNHIAHEYPDNPSLMAKNLRQAQVKAKELVDYWDQLKPEIEKFIRKYDTVS